MTPCKLCRQPALTAVLDFGDQALTNRFLRSPGEAQYAHALAIGACDACGTVQLLRPAPPEEVRPRFDWLSYNEPEGHLDDVAAAISRLPGLTQASRICGVTYKDASTLRRLRALGFAQTWLVDPPCDLGVNEPAGVESIQQNFTLAAAARLVQKHGRPKVVVVRHVLEHAHDIHEFLGALRELVAPDGWLIVEAPDAVRPLERCDYGAVWEEHVFYFTPATLRRCFALGGLDVVALKSYPYTPENSIVAVIRPSADASPRDPGDDVVAEVGRMCRFGDRYPEVKAAWSESLAAAGRTAVLGAGHHGAAFVNLLGLERFIDFVADDEPRKQGLYMPGSRLPILGSDQLAARSVRLCLMSVRPEIEETVARNQAAFTAKGGRLASIFPDSPHAFRPGRKQTARPRPVGQGQGTECHEMPCRA